MKTLILTAVLAVFATAAFAQKETSAMSNDYTMSTNEISVAIYPNATDEVTMILSKEEGQKVKVRVTGSNDEVLYTKRYGKVNNAKVTYDVSDFPAGDYTFEVMDGKEVLYTKTITRNDNTIALAR